MSLSRPSKSCLFFSGTEVAMIEIPSYLATPHDPSQDPAHRWRRAGCLIDHDLTPFWAKDDSVVWTAWRYRRELAGCPVHDDGVIVAPGFTAIAEAHRCYAAAPPMVRAELEARLLAGQSDEAVAAKVNMSPAGVAAYHALFFEVRPHLQADTYIATIVLGGKVQCGLRRDDHALLMKAIGYGMGGDGVDQYLDFVNDPPVVPRCLDQLDLPSLKKLRDRTAFQVGVLAMTTPASAAAPAAWLWLRERFASGRRAAAASEDSPAWSIPPALEAAAFVAAAPPVRDAEDRQGRREERRARVRRPVRVETAALQEIRLAVPA
jgi:hypothetical protein